jgi:hypothetical protein
MIPFRERGMYQAAQNVLHGFGSICGASLGGAIADTIGWRWCFLLQVPVSLFALGIGHLVIKNQAHIENQSLVNSPREVWKKVDFSGAALLILGLSLQLVGLSLGGNELPWSNIWVILSLVVSVVLLLLFLLVEARTTAMPVIPLRMLRGTLPVATQVANVCVGMAAYAVSNYLPAIPKPKSSLDQFLFMIPLFFQVILLDSASRAGARLVIPSLATPIGGLIAGIVMTRWGKLSLLVRVGSFLMVVGNLLVMTFKFHDDTWRYFLYLVPANLGQGMAYPGILFTFLATFDHAGEIRYAFRLWRVCTDFLRPRRFSLHRLHDSLARHCMGRGHHLRNYPKRPGGQAAPGTKWSIRKMESTPFFPLLNSKCRLLQKVADLLDYRRSPSLGGGYKHTSSGYSNESPSGVL